MPLLSLIIGLLPYAETLTEDGVNTLTNLFDAHVSGTVPSAADMAAGVLFPLSVLPNIFVPGTSYVFRLKAFALVSSSSNNNIDNSNNNNINNNNNNNDDDDDDDDDDNNNENE